MIPSLITAAEQIQNRAIRRVARGIGGGASSGNDTVALTQRVSGRDLAKLVDAAVAQLQTTGDPESVDSHIVNFLKTAGQNGSIDERLAAAARESADILQNINGKPATQEMIDSAVQKLTAARSALEKDPAQASATGKVIFVNSDNAPPDGIYRFGSADDAAESIGLERGPAQASNPQLPRSGPVTLRALPVSENETAVFVIRNQDTSKEIASWAQQLTSSALSSVPTAVFTKIFHDTGSLQFDLIENLDSVLSKSQFSLNSTPGSQDDPSAEQWLRAVLDTGGKSMDALATRLPSAPSSSIPPALSDLARLMGTVNFPGDSTVPEPPGITEEALKNAGSKAEILPGIIRNLGLTLEHDLADANDSTPEPLPEPNLQQQPLPPSQSRTQAQQPEPTVKNLKIVLLTLLKEVEQFQPESDETAPARSPWRAVETQETGSRAALPSSPPQAPSADPGADRESSGSQTTTAPQSGPVDNPVKVAGIRYELPARSAQRLRSAVETQTGDAGPQKPLPQQVSPADREKLTAIRATLDKVQQQISAVPDRIADALVTRQAALAPRTPITSTGSARSVPAPAAPAPGQAFIKIDKTIRDAIATLVKFINTSTAPGTEEIDPELPQSPAASATAAIQPKISDPALRARIDPAIRAISSFFQALTEQENVPDTLSKFPGFMGGTSFSPRGANPLDAGVESSLLISNLLGKVSDSLEQPLLFSSSVVSAAQVRPAQESDAPAQDPGSIAQQASGSGTRKVMQDVESALQSTEKEVWNITSGIRDQVSVALKNVPATTGSNVYSAEPGSPAQNLMNALNSVLGAPSDIRDTVTTALTSLSRLIEGRLSDTETPQLTSAIPVASSPSARQSADSAPTVSNEEGPGPGDTPAPADPVKDLLRDVGAALGRAVDRLEQGLKDVHDSVKTVSGSQDSPQQGAASPASRQDIAFDRAVRAIDTAVAKLTRELGDLQRDLGQVLEPAVRDAEGRQAQSRDSLSAQKSPSSGDASGKPQDISNVKDSIRQPVETLLNRIESLQVLARQVSTSSGDQQLIALPMKIGGEWTDVHVRFIKKERTTKGNDTGRSFSVFLNVAPSNSGSIAARMDYDKNRSLRLSIEFERPETRGWFVQHRLDLQKSMSELGLPAPSIELRSSVKVSTVPEAGPAESGLSQNDGTIDLTV